jgi:hypothetical protein
MRDLWRRGSGMTLRRLMVLIRALPGDGVLWSAVREAEKKALKPTVEQIRARAAHYAKQAEEAE